MTEEFEEITDQSQTATEEVEPPAPAPVYTPEKEFASRREELEHLSKKLYRSTSRWQTIMRQGFPKLKPGRDDETRLVMCQHMPDEAEVLDILRRQDARLEKMKADQKRAEDEKAARDHAKKIGEYAQGAVKGVPAPEAEQQEA